MTQESFFPDIPPKTEKQDQKHREAQRNFEDQLAKVPYGDRYAALVGEGWDWRKAVYIAWASLPSSKREPSTLKELAEQIGVSRGMFSAWRGKNPAINARIARFSAGNLLEHIADVDQALLNSAKSDEYKSVQDRRLFYERAGVITSRHKIDLTARQSEGKALEDMTSEELAAEVAREEHLAELARKEAEENSGLPFEEGGEDDR